MPATIEPSPPPTQEVYVYCQNLKCNWKGRRQYRFSHRIVPCIKCGQETGPNKPERPPFNHAPAIKVWCPSRKCKWFGYRQMYNALEPCPKCSVPCTPEKPRYVRKYANREHIKTSSLTRAAKERAQRRERAQEVDTAIKARAEPKRAAVKRQKAVFATDKDGREYTEAEFKAYMFAQKIRKQERERLDALK